MTVLRVNTQLPVINLLASPEWKDYELLDSGDGSKLERFGQYLFVRPEHQAVWKPAMPQKRWKEADAVFQSTGEESGGRWQVSHAIEPEWEMRYKALRFMARVANSRHLGVFPEQASHWDWIADQVQAAKRPVQILNLFGYTGLATLAAAQAGAAVTHVDASSKTVAQARQNQVLSGLTDHPIRWIVDDALKFVRREARRGASYDGIILDPPKFGRGPKGEVWEFFKMLPLLLQEIRPILGRNPLFLVITAYAIRASALSIYYAVNDMMKSQAGEISTGELVNLEKSSGRILSMAISTRWCSTALHSGRGG